MELTRIIPPTIRSSLRRLQHEISTHVGLRDPLIPPPWAPSLGGTDWFAETGEEFLRHLRKYCALEPHHTVLDLGCGIGRIARSLARYLTTGSYFGIDIMEPSIHWCRGAYRRHHPNFHFRFIDVY